MPRTKTNENTENSPTTQPQKPGQDFYFPEQNITIRAKSLEDAQKQLKTQVKEQEQDNG